jgi:ribosomal protein S27E
MSNADWWAQKLAQQNGQAPVQQGRPDSTPPMPPSQQPLQAMPSFQPQVAQTKAQSARLADTCPDCGSSNYMAASPQTSLRCYDCGYPVQQSGSRFGGLAGANVEGAAKQASGNSAGSWNPAGPGHIISHIG